MNSIMLILFFGLDGVWVHPKLSFAFTFDSFQLSFFWSFCLYIYLLVPCLNDTESINY